MGWLSRLGLGGRKAASGNLDRAADDADVQALVDFVSSRTGVEFFLEPRTNMTAHTIIAIAHDGEWTRRRIGGPVEAGRLATKLHVPLYEVHKVGYPQRMRAWNAAHPERRLR